MRTKWDKGEPPHAGWWNVQWGEENPPSCAWRFWNGEFWSAVCYSWTSQHLIDTYGGERPLVTSGEIVWCDYWPRNARVPRVKP